MVFRRVDFGPQQLLPPHRIALMSSRRLLPSPWYDLGLGFPGFLAGDEGKVLTICWVMGAGRSALMYSISLFFLPLRLNLTTYRSILLFVAGSISFYDTGYNSDFGKSRHRAWWESMYLEVGMANSRRKAAMARVRAL